jgi:hypothetical protein
MDAGHDGLDGTGEPEGWTQIGPNRTASTRDVNLALARASEARAELERNGILPRHERGEDFTSGLQPTEETGLTTGELGEQVGGGLVEIVVRRRVRAFTLGQPSKARVNKTGCDRLSEERDDRAR